MMTLIAAHRPAFRQKRTFRRVVALRFGKLAAFAGHTVTKIPHKIQLFVITITIRGTAPPRPES
ncbi:hypothetical protein [Chloroflexus sp.]|uniref:hypothetical protein n=1 Tax=Chloroflexus sp. TaxID=1904827 RepID=UPI002ADDC262|nr:hypothetical protein [Chloroflexus sp.]